MLSQLPADQCSIQFATGVTRISLSGQEASEPILGEPLKTLQSTSQPLTPGKVLSRISWPTWCQPTRLVPVDGMTQICLRLETECSPRTKKRPTLPCGPSPKHLWSSVAISTHLLRIVHPTRSLPLRCSSKSIRMILVSKRPSWCRILPTMLILPCTEHQLPRTEQLTLASLW